MGGRSAPSLRDRALALLARREYSRAELAGRLGGGEDGDPEALQGLLDQLEAEGLLSDARFAEALVRTRAARFGPARVALELRQRGVDDDLARAALDALPDPRAQARDVWARRFGRAPVDARDRARQVRFLQGRGFSIDVALAVVDGRES